MFAIASWLLLSAFLTAVCHWARAWAESCEGSDGGEETVLIRGVIWQNPKIQNNKYLIYFVVFRLTFDFEFIIKKKTISIHKNV